MTTEAAEPTNNENENENENKEEEEEEIKQENEDEEDSAKRSKKRKFPKRLDPVLSAPLTNWRSACGLGTSKKSRESMTSILAGLTKRDEELEEKSKAWEQEKKEITKKVQEEHVIISETRIVGRGIVHDEDGVDPASLVEELFENADTVVLFTKRLFMKNLYQYAENTQRKQHSQFQSQQRQKMQKLNPSPSPSPFPSPFPSLSSPPPSSAVPKEPKVSPDKLLQSFQQAFQQQFSSLSSHTPASTPTPAAPAQDSKN